MPRDGGVVRLHVEEGYFSTPPKWVTSPTWSSPPPCKQALSYIYNGSISNFDAVDHEILRCLHSIGTSLIELKHGNNCFLEFKRNRRVNFCETLFLIWPLQ